MKNFRSDKIRELKENIRLAQTDLAAYRREFNEFVVAKVDGETEKEERKTQIQERAKIMSQKVAVLEALAEELKITRMNKYSSPNFEFHPSPPNRRVRRLMARM